MDRRGNTLNSDGGGHSFLSVIKRYKFGEDNNSKKYVEYEIASQLRIAGLRVQKDIVFKWSSWKRFSDFEKLHALLRERLGWQMDGIEFPSSHTFVLNKLSSEFIERRKYVDHIIHHIMHHFIR